MDHYPYQYNYVNHFRSHNEEEAGGIYRSPYSYGGHGGYEDSRFFGAPFAGGFLGGLLGTAILPSLYGGFGGYGGGFGGYGGSFGGYGGYGGGFGGYGGAPGYGFGSPYGRPGFW